MTKKYKRKKNKAPRNYDKEYDRDHSSEKAKDKRVRLNKLRRQAIAAGTASVGDGKENSHKKSMEKGGSDSPDNVEYVSREENRNRPWKYRRKKKS